MIGVSAGLYVSGTSPLFWFKQQPSKNRNARESTNQDLEGLGYVGGRATSDRERGVLTHDREDTAKGKNFYCGDQGYRAFLMDMDGDVLHRWHYPFEKAFGYENKRNPEELAELGKDRPDPSWSKCHLFEDGSVLALIRDRGLVKIDRDSNLLWKQEIQAHHDFWVGESGIYVLMRQVNTARRMYKRPDDKFEEDFVEDFIVHLSHDGEIVDQYSLLQMIVESTYQPLLFHTLVGFDYEKPVLRTKDVLHPNSVQILFPGSPIHEQLTKVQGPLALVSM